MKNKDHLCLHIGLHKSGSSFLQRKVFPDMFPNAPLDPLTGVQLPELNQQFRNCNIDDNISIISHEGFLSRINTAEQGAVMADFCNNVILSKRINMKPDCCLLLQRSGINICIRTGRNR